jgi:hypothetical protein
LEARYATVCERSRRDLDVCRAGDAIQHTTGGLLVWRKLDNWTTFTDGFHTWVNGPYGLQERLNDQRFGWEANPDGLPVVP